MMFVAPGEGPNVEITCARLQEVADTARCGKSDHKEDAQNWQCEHHAMYRTRERTLEHSNFPT